MWGWGRRLRDLPPINYNESESESDLEDDLALPADAFNEAFATPNVSPQPPQQPVHTREGSPQLLAHPTLNDNVDDVLEDVQYRLGDIQQVLEEVDDLTDLLEDTDFGVDPLENQEGAEEVLAFNFKVPADKEVEADNNMPENNQPAAPAPPPAVNYDIEDKNDGDKSADQARSIKIEFSASDIRFWFSQLEDEMTMASVGSQWLKKTVLQRNLPIKQKEDVKSFLTLQKEQAGAHIYLDIKNELIRIYAQKPCDSYRKALTRTMVGLPSQLGYQIVDDVCKKPQKLSGCCCPAAVLAIWSMQLPVNIRAHISGMDLTSESYKTVFEAADKVYLSSKQVSVAAVATPVSLDETLPAFTTQNQPEVAAIASRRGRGNQNRGRSGTGRGGGQNRGGRRNQGQAQGQARTQRGQRHSSMPPESCCERHYVHGDQAWYCLAPLTCPWVSKCISRP